ncbi:hypothetical protein ONZ45_g7257 [Pleurotus djamor]|nr:hypothetical protein ONZ45_g7257 [Pleurotus djamor]
MGGRDDKQAPQTVCEIEPPRLWDVRRLSGGSVTVDGNGCVEHDDKAADVGEEGETLAEVDMQVVVAASKELVGPDA